MTDIRSIATKNRIKIGLLSCMKEKGYDTDFKQRYYQQSSD